MSVKRRAEQLTALENGEQMKLAREIISEGQAEEAILHLQTLWWGDNPLECRYAWELIEALQKNSGVDKPVEA